MEGTRGRAAAAALLAAGLAAAGCCGLQRGSPIGNRDTPEAAFAFVRDAFREDRTGDQVDSLHQRFQERQGISSTRYALARGLRPGLFRKAADLLGAARLVSVEYARIDTRKGPADPPRLKDAAKLRLAVPGGEGVFILVDEPVWTLYTDDEETGPLWDYLPGVDRAVRIEGGKVVVDLHGDLGVLPKDGARVRRIEIHHDWQLFDIESLKGFEEFLGQVKEAADQGRGGEAPQ